MTIQTKFKQTQWAKNWKKRFSSVGLLPKTTEKTETKPRKKKVTTQNKVTTQATKKRLSLGEFIKYSSRKIQGKKTYAKKR